MFIVHVSTGIKLNSDSFTSPPAGPDGDEDKGREFLSGLYERLAVRHGRHYVSRFTEATNTENFNSIFSFVKNIVNRNMISRGGLL